MCESEKGEKGFATGKENMLWRKDLSPLRRGPPAPASGLMPTMSTSSITSTMSIHYRDRRILNCRFQAKQLGLS